MTHRYRLEYASKSEAGDQVISLDVPDIATALVVADINVPGHSAQLWDGEKKVAQLRRQKNADSGYWMVN